MLSGSLFGALTSSPVAIALLAVAQTPGGSARTGDAGARPAPHRGRPSSSRRSCGESRAKRLDVAPADNELRLLDQAIKPNSQSTELFSAISVMVGFLLALNAMLLTMPERRRFVADLRMQGYDRRQVLAAALLPGARPGDRRLAGRHRARRRAFQRVLPSRARPIWRPRFPIGAKQIVHPRTVLAAFRLRRHRHRARVAHARIRPARWPSRGRRVSRVRGRGETISGRATRTLGLAGTGLDRRRDRARADCART